MNYQNCSLYDEQCHLFDDFICCFICSARSILQPFWWSLIINRQEEKVFVKNSCFLFWFFRFGNVTDQCWFIRPRTWRTSNQQKSNTSCLIFCYFFWKARTFLTMVQILLLFFCLCKGSRILYLKKKTQWIRVDDRGYIEFTIKLQSIS